MFFVFQSFLYIAWYFIFSAMGNFNYFFFAAHLLDVAIGFKTLRTILQSVTHNGKQVLKVLEIQVTLQTALNSEFSIAICVAFNRFYCVSLLQQLILRHPQKRHILG